LDFYFTRHDASLGQHVTNLAELGTALVVMKRHSAGFLAPQICRSIARAINSHITTIARAQLEGVRECYLFFDGTHDVEKLFGILRTLQGALRNFDPVQLEERMSTVVGLRGVYDEHPTWQGTSRLLSSSVDHMNTRTWTGCVDPCKVNLMNCWCLGISAAAQALRTTGIYSEAELSIGAIVAENPSITLLHWNGRVADADEGDAEERRNARSTPRCLGGAVARRDVTH